MIAAPQRVRVESAGGEYVDSTAMTKESIPPAPSTPESNSHSETLDGSETSPADAEEFRLLPIDGAPSPTAPPMAGSQPPGTSEWHTTDMPLVPTEHWTSESSAKTKQYLTIGFIGLGGIALASLLFIVFLQWYSPRNQLAPELASSAADGQQPGGSPTGPARLDEIPQHSSDSPSLAEADVPSSADGVTVQPPPEATAEAITSIAVRPPSSPVDAAENATVAAPRRTVDDLFVDPPPLSSRIEPPESPDTSVTELPDELASDDSGDQQEADPSAGADPSANLPKQLQAFAPMLQWQVQPQLPDAVAVLAEAPVTAEDLGLPTGDDLAAQASIDWSLHSQTVLSGLIIGPQPLSHWMNLWTNVSGVPTTISLDSLMAANFDRDMEVSLGMVKNATISQVATQFAQSIGLQAAPRENRYLQISAPASRIQDNLPDAISLTGLVEVEQHAWLIETLERLLPQSQGGWSVAGTELERDSRVDDPTWFDALRLIESWRAARGAPPETEAYDPRNVVRRFQLADEMPRLETELKYVSGGPRTVGPVISQICQHAGIQAWIDWAHVGEVGLGPDTTATVITSSRPLRFALHDYAEQYSLIVAIEDERSLWITSPRAYREQVCLYAVPSEGMTVEQWGQRLRGLTPARDGTVESVIVIPTPGADVVLVRCCRPTLDF